MKMEYVAIAIFLPDTLANSVVSMSKLLGEKYNSWYVLDKEIFNPHLTVWLAHVPTVNLRSIYDKMSVLIKQLSHFDLNVKPITVSDDGYVFLPVTNNSYLFNMHNLLLSELNSFRDNYIPKKYINNIDNYTKEQQISIKKYGTRMAGDLFNAHISVGFVDPVFNQEIINSPCNLTCTTNFDVNKLMLFKQKESGKSIDILGEFLLS